MDSPENSKGLRYIVERAPVEVYSDSQLKLLATRTKPLSVPSVGAIRRVGKFQVLTDEPIRQNRFVDTKIDLSRPKPIEGDSIFDEVYIMDRHLTNDGRPYRFAVFAYRIRSVNAMGVVGGPSPARLTIPAPVQYLVARDGDTTCDLRWQPNQEQGIAGYRVYRIDGRWDKTDPVSRLTPQPITATRFHDPQAGRKTRRYHVIAVDAIGQEGHPSSPVWYRREWKSFYRPFDEEWHQ